MSLKTSSKPIAALISDLEDKSWLTRSRAAEALTLLGDDARKAVPALIVGLSDCNAEVRYDCVAALESIGPYSKKATDPLIEMLDDQIIARGVIKALVAIGRSAIQSLVLVLGENQRSQHAELALTKIGVPAVSGLIDALKSNDEAVRWRAASVLRDIGPIAKDAIPALVHMVNNSEEVRAVRFWASTALKTIEPTFESPLIGSLRLSEANRVRWPH